MSRDTPPLREEIRRLMIAVNRIDGLYYRAARQLGVKINTLTLLYALDDGEPHSQKQICEAWCIPRTTINTVVQECVQAGYVTLSEAPHAKEKTLHITPAGRAHSCQVLGGIYRAEGEAMAQTLARFSPAFVDAAEDFSHRLEAEFEKNLTPGDPDKHRRGRGANPQDAN